MDIVKAVKKEVDKIAMDNEIILFGSRARGDFKQDSDWDFLILLNDNESNLEKKEYIKDKLYDIELELEQVVSSIIYSKTEWEQRAIMPIYEIIKQEGIKLSELLQG